MASVPADAPIRHPDRFFIDGAWVRPSSDRMIEVVAPATEQVWMRVAEAQVADIDRAIGAARTAFDNGPWPRLTHAERGAFLSAIAAELDHRAEDVGHIWPNEMGVLHATARVFAGKVGGLYAFYGGLADRFAFEEERPSGAGAACGLLVREPVGVVGAIIPWNGPISLIALKLAPALLAGCTVVIKASPEAPGHALLMAEIVEKIGLPPGVVNVVTADRAVSEALVRDPRVDKIAFTGSTEAGRKIGAVLGGRVARQTLELGGKSAAIVLDDYDVGVAARTIAGRACDLTGQVCASLTRVIVDRERHDEMLAALAAAFAAVKVGDPFDPASQMGPLATERQRERVEGHIAAARAGGFTLAAGGGRPRHLDRGWYVEPTVFGHVDNRARLAREEVFGPVLAVIPAQSETEAVALANDNPFGLAGAVFTNDVDRAYAVARGVRTGTMSHNVLRLDFGIAFGGFKQSGVGREGGVEGLMPYLETKTILLDARPAHLDAPAV